MTNPTPADAAIREQALDPRLCCIVQAPAGSGKTELLIQRMLVLLAHVERPEEILAITFTRKAAGEMQARILQALREAHAPLPADAPAHRLQQRARAQAVLARDAEQGWHLLEHPARLRIQTIDAFSHALAARLPLTARLGAAAAISDDATALYREAAERVIARIEQGMDSQAPEDAEVVALETLLRHLGNDLTRVRDLLAAMLGKRDQWGRHVVGQETSGEARRAQLEGAIQRMIMDELDSLAALFPTNLKDETAAVAAQLGTHLAAAGVAEDDRRLLWQDGAWPKAGVEGLARWQGLADLLLTKEGAWRKSLKTSEGVPSPSEKGLDKDTKAARAAFKERVQALLARLAAHPDLASALHATRAMPAPCYSDGEWAVLEALIHLLKLAWSELWLIFAARGEVDFIETAQGALRALGEGDAPSDLLLAFDYRLRHILVDEFQDTSHTQFALLERLLAGWQPGELPFTEAEGRTLFLVGDPMQSIYRFREAEVGLFLRAQREGIRCGGGVLRLAPLTLSTNFRSQAGIVEWVNATFPHVLAERENIAEGAVPYTPSQAFHPKAAGEAVRLCLLPRSSEEAGEAGGLEAAEVVRLTRAALAELDEDEQVKAKDRTVAILVRARGHLAKLLPALRAAGIPFQAVEIEKLADQPMVQDLWALTRALLHPADRIAWLAILRAPWCGLELGDLHALAEGGESMTLWQAMHDPMRLAKLSPEGRARLARLRSVLETSLAESGRVPLRRQVEGAWLALGGPACARSSRELEEAAIFLDLLDQLGETLDAASLEEALAELYAPPESETRVQVMTIHKAKGLQFHTVIVPGLARVPAGSDSQLLLWLERETNRLGRSEVELLLAPIKGVGEQDSPLYSWLARILQARGGFEDGRLLYVAATRAIQRLYLVAEIGRDEEGTWQPPARSLLARLWPGIAHQVEAGPLTSAEPERPALPASPFARPALRRLPLAWQPPVPPSGLAVEQTRAQPLSRRASLAREEGGEPEALDDTPRHVGTLVHRLLERIALEGLESWDDRRLEALTPALERSLLELGVRKARLDEACKRVRQAVQTTLADPRGRWILSPHHDARCEWALGGVIDGALVSAVIDRSFIAEGVRWIIDYKTSEPLPGEALQDFLARQQAHYRPQLEGYATLLKALDPSLPLWLGLYFPLVGGWCAWAQELGE